VITFKFAANYELQARTKLTINMLETKLTFFNMYDLRFSRCWLWRIFIIFFTCLFARFLHYNTVGPIFCNYVLSFAGHGHKEWDVYEYLKWVMQYREKWRCLQLDFATSLPLRRWILAVKVTALVSTPQWRNMSIINAYLESCTFYWPWCSFTADVNRMTRR
jgi:hypothetical protein